MSESGLSSSFARIVVDSFLVPVGELPARFEKAAHKGDLVGEVSRALAEVIQVGQGTSRSGPQENAHLARWYLDELERQTNVRTHHAPS